MNHLTFPYRPAEGTGAQLPLSRYLPPIQPGMVADWLRENVPVGSWLLEPLGASPALALEAAQAGYRVLVASNNPVLSFMLEVLASAPQPQELRKLLVDLSDTRRGAERLEVHLQALYQTECVNCDATIPVQAFLWKRGDAQPYARLYRCPRCGDDGERPLTEADHQRVALLGNPALHRARALERVNLGQVDLPEGIEDSIQSYLPRALHFVFTLLNKIDGMGLPSSKKRLLTAMALSLCDEGNCLWTYPAARLRPRQLIVPGQFRENNLWLALEQAMADWSTQKTPVACTRWPELPSADGGICLYPGRVKALFPLPETIRLRAAVVAFPRPNQAFWTYSAVWSGWLWGKEAVIPLKHALERQRYDWNWHAGALHASLSALRKQVNEGFEIFGLLSDLAPGFLAAALVAAEGANFHLQGLALRDEEETALALWRAAPSHTTPGLDVSRLEREAMQDVLRQCGQPMDYMVPFAAGMSALAVSGVLPSDQVQLAFDVVNRTQGVVNQSLADGAVFKRFSAASQSPEGGLYANQGMENTDDPLSDRVEFELVNYLQEHAVCQTLDVERHLCQKFPGLLTPSGGLVRACLLSYAQQNGDGEETWQLRAEDTLAARRQDLRTLRGLLAEMAGKVGLEAHDDNPLLWTDGQGTIRYAFFLTASSRVSRYVLKPAPIPPDRCVILLPGSRASLLMYKIRRDPRLEQAIDQGWHFVKFRYLRQLAEQADLKLETWERSLDGDMLTGDEPTQMRMFR